MNKKQQILKKIREGCPELMKLSMLCEVRKYGNVFIWIDIQTYENNEHYCHYVDKNTKQDHRVRLETKEVEEFEIIGHPPQLNHLLRVMKNPSSIMLTPGNSLFLSYKYCGELYDLDLSVEENLDDSEKLTDFLFDLICEDV